MLVAGLPQGRVAYSDLLDCLGPELEQSVLLPPGRQQHGLLQLRPQAVQQVGVGHAALWQPGDQHERSSLVDGNVVPRLLELLLQLADLGLDLARPDRETRPHVPARGRVVAEDFLPAILGRLDDDLRLSHGFPF